MLKTVVLHNIFVETFVEILFFMIHRWIKIQKNGIYLKYKYFVTFRSTQCVNAI